MCVCVCVCVKYGDHYMIVLWMVTILDKMSSGRYQYNSDYACRFVTLLLYILCVMHYSCCTAVAVKKSAQKHWTDGCKKFT